jgi:hypothetical protein
MPSRFRVGFCTGVAFALLVGCFLFWLWQPGRQVNRHSENLLREIEGENWTAISDFLANDYADQWGDDRTLALARMREGFRYARTMRIHALNPVVNVDGRRGVWRAKITIDGDDGEVLAFLRERVNSLATPFELEWSRVSAKPWDWKLASVRNRDLEVPAGID